MKKENLIKRLETSKRIKHLITDFNHLFPYMSLKWRKALILQIYYLWEHGYRGENYCIAMFSTDFNQRRKAYLNIIDNTKASTVYKNMMLLSKEF